MRRMAILGALLLILINIAQAQYIMTIDLNESGNAMWTIEKRLPFTKAEIKEWEGIITSGQNITRASDIAELNDLINQFNDSVLNFSNRSMEIEAFNSSRILYSTEKTASDSFGVISYRFLWKNFSTKESGKILVGDAFSDRKILTSENVLIINIPEGYQVINSTPDFDRQDRNRLIWEGKLYRNFGIGEPSLVLTRANNSNTTGIIENTITSFPDMGTAQTFVLGFLAAMLIGTAVMFLKRRRSTNKTSFFNDLIQAPKDLQQLLKVPAFMNFLQKEFGPKDIQELEKAAQDHVQKPNMDDQSSSNGELEDENEPIVPITEELIGYEEMIEQFVSKSGGQAFQSDIVKEIGLSKSKISNLLADMKDKGRIIKIRRGKENIIRLADRQVT